MQMQNNTVLLKNNTTKIFLNTDSRQNDGSSERKAFLDYATGKYPHDLFVIKLKDTATEAGKNRKWRLTYMTLLMRDQENIEKGFEKGIEKGIHGAISICRDLGLSDDDISKRLQEKYDLSKKDADNYLQAEINAASPII